MGETNQVGTLPPEKRAKYVDSESESEKKLFAFILESTDTALGKEMIFELADRHPSLQLRRVDPADIGPFLVYFNQVQIDQFPAVVVIKISQDQATPW